MARWSPRSSGGAGQQQPGAGHAGSRSRCHPLPHCSAMGEDLLCALNKWRQRWGGETPPTSCPFPLCLGAQRSINCPGEGSAGTNLPKNSSFPSDFQWTEIDIWEESLAESHLSVWPALAAVLRSAPGWRRSGRQPSGPCPSASGPPSTLRSYFAVELVLFPRHGGV